MHIDTEFPLFYPIKFPDLLRVFHVFFLSVSPRHLFFLNVALVTLVYANIAPLSTIS